MQNAESVLLKKIYKILLQCFQNMLPKQHILIWDIVQSRLAHEISSQVKSIYALSAVLMAVLMFSIGPTLKITGKSLVLR